jgi:hypothetical protein
MAYGAREPQLQSSVTGHFKIPLPQNNFPARSILKQQLNEKL